MASLRQEGDTGLAQYRAANTRRGRLPDPSGSPWTRSGLGQLGSRIAAPTPAPAFRVLT